MLRSPGYQDYNVADHEQTQTNRQANTQGNKLANDVAIARRQQRMQNQLERKSRHDKQTSFGHRKVAWMDGPFVAI